MTCRPQLPKLSLWDGWQAVGALGHGVQRYAKILRLTGLATSPGVWLRGGSFDTISDVLEPFDLRQLLNGGEAGSESCYDRTVLLDLADCLKRPVEVVELSDNVDDLVVDASQAGWPVRGRRAEERRVEGTDETITNDSSSFRVGRTVGNQFIAHGRQGFQPERRDDDFA